MTEDESPDETTTDESNTSPSEGAPEGESVEVETGASDETAGEPGDTEGGARERLEAGADRAVNELDTKVIDILSWVLDTETRGRIYVYLRQQAWSTSEEVAEGTGLYPSTVREALAELADEEIVERRKRESEGAGNNPYEYTSIAPSELVGSVVGRVQEELNTIFTMDQDETDEEGAAEPVQIEVQEPDEDE